MLLDAARTVLATVVVAGAALGAGCWIERALPSSFSPIDLLACSWLGGLGISGILLFLVGQFAFTPATIVVILLMLVLGAIAPIMRLLRAASASAARGVKIPALPAAVIAFVLLLTAFGGLADVDSRYDDAITYHFLGPKVWLREGAVRPLPEECRTAFPATGEILFGSFMALGGQHAPGFSAVFTLSLFFLVVFSLSTRAGLDAGRAWWVVALVAAMPAVYTGAQSGFVDVLYASFVLAAARIGFDAQRPSHYMMFGLFCGLAIATKYTGLMAVPVLALCTVLLRTDLSRAGWRLPTENVGMAIAVACMVGAPFYVRNWLLLGSPIYPPPPILSSIFHVKNLSADAISQFHAFIYKRGAGLGHGLGAYLALPFNLTYHTANFDGVGGIGLTPLALAPFGLVALRRESFPRALALLGLLLTTLWFWTDQESRFLIHVYVIGAIFAVIGWGYVRSTGRRYSSVLCGAVIGCSLLYGSVMIVKSRLDDVHAVVSPSFAEKRRSEQIPFLESFEFLNSDASVQKVLILDLSVPPYYLNRSYLKLSGRWGEQVLPDATDVEHVLERLHYLHISHVLDVESEVSAFRVPTTARGLTLVFERAKQRIYRLD